MSLNTRRLTKRFGAVEALRDVTFSVPQGSTWGLLGPNGSGKTTTMRIMLGIVPPDGGQVEWQGVPTSRWPRHIWGYLPEERGLYPKMRVREQLIYLGRLQGMTAASAAAQVDRWLRRLDMQAAAHRRLEQLSKGNQQKIQFVAAILHDPVLLLLDEPFSGLDPANAAVLRAVLEELRRQGRTIIFSSHRLDHVRELCDGITLLQGGRVVVHGTLEEVLAPFREPRVLIQWSRPLPAEDFDRLPVRPQRIEGPTAWFDLREGWPGAATPAPGTQRPANGRPLPPWDDPALAERSQELLAAASRLAPVVRFQWEEPDLEAVYIQLTGHAPDQLPAGDREAEHHGA